jgi:hypothetical protein
MRIGLIPSILKSPTPSVSRLYRDLKPGLREYLLRAHLPVRIRAGIGEQIEAHLREADRICNLLGARHMRAHHAEKQGRDKDAIQLYEQNVADADLSTLSYERLRTLYLRMGRRNDARRVCEAYLRALDELAALDPNLPAWAISNRKRFTGYLNELRRR